MKLNFECERYWDWVTTALRMVVGWHLLYLGYWAITTTGGFSYAGPFHCARWLFGDLLRKVSYTPAMCVIDVALPVLLIVAGLLLVIGWKRRVAAAIGIFYFVLCYLLNPPHFGHTGESHFMYVSRDVIEIAMLLLVSTLPGVGIVDTIRLLKCRAKDPSEPELVDEDRRRLIAGLASVPVVAAFGGSAVWTALMRKEEVVRITGPSIKPFSPSDLTGLGHKMTAYGKIGDVELSRLILGGNIIGGWAHARDMRYYDKLVKAYYTDERVFRTFRMAEACGVNTILTNPALMRVINRYWREDGGKIKFISDCGYKGGIVEGAKVSVENGASLVYTHGGMADSYAVDGKWDKIEEFLVEGRKLGVPTGIGCHRLATVKGCVERGLIPDFWMKTVHRVDYPTAHIGEQGGKKSKDGLGLHDNRFVDTDRQEVFDYMESRPEPWIAFKILGAGIEHPKTAFPAAFLGGADFACVGMYDYQMVEDVNIANEIFEQGLPERKRKWH